MQALPMTLRTLTLRKELVGPFLSATALVIVHHRTQVFYHTVKLDEIVTRCMNQLLVDAYTLQRAIENLAQGFFRNICYLVLQVALILMQNGIYLPEYHLILVFA